MNTKEKWKGGMIASWIAVLILGVIAAAMASSGSPKADPTDTNTSVIYYANSAVPGTFDFGPNNTRFTTKEDAVKRFEKKMDHDPLFAAVQVKSSEDGLDIDASDTEALAREYVKDRNKWAADVKEFKDSITSYDLRDYSGTFDTLGMVPNGAGKMPSLVKISGVKLGQSLDVTLKNGKVLHERTWCDFQLTGPVIKNVPTPSEHGCKHNCGSDHGCKHDCGSGCKHDCGHEEKCDKVSLPDNRYEYDDSRHCSYHKRNQSEDHEQNGSPQDDEPQDNDDNDTKPTENHGDGSSSHDSGGGKDSSPSGGGSDGSGGTHADNDSHDSGQGGDNDDASSNDDVKDPD